MPFNIQPNGDIIQQNVLNNRTQEGKLEPDLGTSSSQDKKLEFFLQNNEKLTI